MVSSFGWLDADDDQQRRMLDVIDLFRERSTLDDLGIGAIRDAFSDQLFPGTSTLHTRLRYVLFVPWLIQRAVQRGTDPDGMRSAFARDEFQMMQSLKASGHTQGVIGARAGKTLRVWPSTMYWSCLQRWGITAPGSSLDSVFRQAAERRALNRRVLPADDRDTDDNSGPGQRTGGHLLAALDAGLPTPPDDLLKTAGFDLGPDEERYLSERITQSTAGSLLAWLVVNPPAVLPERPWDLPSWTLPTDLARTIDHARRFSIAIHGAHLVYNFLVAQVSGRVELEISYRTDLREWERELARERVLDNWDHDEFWSIVTRQIPRIPARTQDFVERWLDLLAEQTAAAERPGPVADNRAIQDLIRDRECSIKRSRARLGNPAARDSWSGSSGLGRLTYRWSTASSHLNDLYVARQGNSSVQESA